MRFDFVKPPKLLSRLFLFGGIAGIPLIRSLLYVDGRMHSTDVRVQVLKWREVLVW